LREQDDKLEVLSARAALAVAALRCYPRPMRATCLFAASVFSLFTYWQLNDLEQYGTRLWYGWVLIYGLVALISLVSWWRPLPRLLYVGGAGTALLGAAIRLPAIQWSSTIFYNESNPAGNETGGLLVVAIWLALLAWHLKSDKIRREQP
jgi:hypothetical protein